MTKRQEEYSVISDFQALVLAQIGRDELEAEYRALLDEYLAGLLIPRAVTQQKTTFGERALAMHDALSSNSRVDKTKCYRCGSEGKERTNRSSGKRFYICTDDHCGYVGKTGFKNSMWDLDSWDKYHATASGVYKK